MGVFRASEFSELHWLNPGETQGPAGAQAPACFFLASLEEVEGPQSSLFGI